MKKIIISCLAVILVSACNNNIPNNPAVTGNNQINKVSVNKSNLNITGAVEWNTNKFNTKATTSQIATSATVSLIYPYDHPTMPNITIATGLTDNSGNFSINLDNFTPDNNSTYILEASKRLGDVGNSLMSMRTYMKWDGSIWKSITTAASEPKFKINAKTTALTIISEIEHIPVNSTISSMSIVNGVTNPSNITVSPKVVYQSSEGIYVTNSDGTGSPTIISSGTTLNSNPQISADGSKVVYQAAEGIYVANSDGTGSPTIISSGTTLNSNPQISADGSKVTYTGTISSVKHIFVANSNGDTTGGYPKQISSVTTNNLDSQISADGSKVTYYGHNGSSYDIYVANTDGTVSPIKISGVNTNEYNYSSPQISADGTKVAYIEDNGEIFNVYAANSDGDTTGGYPKLISNGSNSYLTTQISGDGSKISYMQDTGELYVSNFDGTSPKLIDTAITSQLSYDGSKITYVNGEIYVANTSGATNMTLVSSDTINNSNPKFSSDNSKVTYTSNDKIFVTKSDGSGEPVEISSTSTNNKFSQFGGVEKSVTISHINDVTTLVTDVLAANYDPLRFIDKVGNNYVSTYNPG